MWRRFGRRGISPLELVENSGELSTEGYDSLIYDLTNFLYYSGDPSRLDRERIGYTSSCFSLFSIYSLGFWDESTQRNSLTKPSLFKVFV